MSNDWKRVRLGDVGEIITGKTPNTKDDENFGSEYKFVTPVDMSKYKKINKTKRYLSEKGLKTQKKQVISGESICVSCIGSDMGKVAIVSGIFVTNQQINTITKIKEDKFNSMYIYYYLTQLKYYFHSIAGGTTMPIINKTSFANIEINLPPLETQEKIANILSSLDEKIENNKRTAEKLEEIAQTLFNRWFVEFNFPDEKGLPYKDNGGEMVESELGLIPKGWEVKKLKETAKVIMGQSPKGTSYNNEKIGKIFFQGRTDFGFRFPSIRMYTTEPKKIADVGDILLSVRAPVGDVNIANDNCCIGRGLASISGEYNSFLFYFIKNSRELFSIYNNSGTIFGAINKNDLESMSMVSPTKIVLNDYEKITKKTDELISNLLIQIQNLENLRDTLLPKLMSGEVEV